MRRKTNAPTLDDVALAAGVSRASASRAIRGEVRVSPEVLEAVQRAVKDLGYVPNRAARSLATQRADAITVIFTETVEHVFGDPFFATTMRGISEVLDAAGKQLVLLLRTSTHDHTHIGYLTAGHTDGVVVVSHRTDDEVGEALAALDLPVAFVGRPPQQMSTANYVDTDNKAGGALVANHLLKQGCRKLAIVTGNLEMPAGIDRLEGWRQALRDAGVDASGVYEADFTVTTAYEATLRLLEEHPDVEGIFAASDLMAMGVARAVEEKGKSIPDDIRLVGYGDLPDVSDMRVPLTTVVNPGVEMARLATRMVLDEITGDLVDGSIIVPPKLIVRQSG